jgi:hypothetical protein
MSETQNETETYAEITVDWTFKSLNQDLQDSRIKQD